MRGPRGRTVNSLRTSVTDCGEERRAWRDLDKVALPNVGCGES